MVGVYAVVEAVEGVGPGGFVEGTGAEGVVGYGVAEEGVGCVFGD